MSYKRLGDQILQALELALDQGNLEVAEHLNKALELGMSAFGGAGQVERRAVPPEWAPALVRLDALRRAHLDQACLNRAEPAELP